MSSSPRPRPASGRGPRGAAIVGFVCMVLVVLPTLVGLDGMNGGYALSFVAAFGVVSAVVVGVMLRSRDRRRDAVIAAPDRVEWTVPPERWSRFLSDEQRTVAGEQRGTFWLVAVILVVVGVLFLAIMRDEAALVVLGVLLGLVPLLKFVSVGSQRRRHRLLQESPPVVVVARDGVLVGDAFFDFGGHGSRFEGVARQLDDDGGAMLVQFSTTTRTGRERHEARLPLPPGNDGSALAERVRSVLGR
jgi:hypothetical protein